MKNDIKKAQFLLNDEQAARGKESCKAQSVKEKNGQIFAVMSGGYSAETLKVLVADGTIEQVIEKLLGKFEFKGTSPMDALCVLPDTSL